MRVLTNSWFEVSSTLNSNHRRSLNLVPTVHSKKEMTVLKSFSVKINYLKFKVYILH